MSNTTTFWELLAQHRIEIPIIQRDYAQGRSNPASKEIRTNFIQQIKESLDKEEGRLHLNFVYGKIHGKSNAIKNEENKEAINGMLTAVQSYSQNLDLGIKWDFIEASEATDVNNQTSFSPLDGQQRLTTLFLLHWYLMPECEDCKNVLKRFNYKIRPSSKDFCEALVANKPDLNDLKGMTISKYISNAAWFFTYWRNDPTVRGMLRMLDKIQLVFGTDHLGEYWESLTVNNKVCFEFMDLDEFKLTDELYIKMNARGVALTPFENFKVWLIEYIQTNKIEVDNKKLTGEDDKTWVDLLDKNWTDLFWKNKDDDNMLIDEELMRYFRNMMQIFLVQQDDFKPNNDSKKAKDDGKNIQARQYREKASLLATDKDKNTGEYKYVPNSFFADNKLLSRENLNMLFDSIHFLSKCSIGIDKIQEILKKQEGAEPISSFGDDRGSIFKRFIDKDTNYRDKVSFYALYVFLKKTDKSKIPLNRDFLRSWMRVIRNLVENSTIDSIPTFKRAIQSISDLENHCLSILQDLKDDKVKPEGFDGYQISEEIRKSKLILDKDILISEDDFLKYENHEYFRGQIDFLLTIADCEKNKDIELFESYAQKLSNIFSHKLKNRESVLFERALLTERSEELDDYLVRVHSNDSFVSLYSNDKYSTDWKKSIFKDEDKLILVKQLLDKIQVEKEIEGLNQICENHTRTGWRKLIIETPAAINYCNKKLIRYKEENQIKLLGQFATNQYHAELFSFCLDKRIKKMEKDGRIDIKPFKSSEYRDVRSASYYSHAVIVGESLFKDYEIHLHFDDVNHKFLKLPYEIKFFSTIEENNSENKYKQKILDVLTKYKFEWKNDEYSSAFWKDFENDDEVIDFLENFCADLNKMQLVSNESVESCI